MKILLGNTGRGGELAIFTAFINAYERTYPEAHIEVMTADNGIYGPIFKNNPRVKWIPLDFRDKSKPYYMNPVGCWSYWAKEKRKEFDIIEFACEHGANHADVVSNIYNRLKHKVFTIDDIIRKPFIYPTDEEFAKAKEIIREYPELVLVSPKSRSATVVFDIDDYQMLADQLLKKYPVAVTGGITKDVTDPGLKGCIDLRGQSFSELYALSLSLKRFVGPDTATSWIVTRMPGKLICLRGCKLYTEENTGLIINKFRTPENTLEMDVLNRNKNGVIDDVLRYFEN